MAVRMDRMVAVVALAAGLLGAGPSAKASERERPSGLLRALILSSGKPQDPKVASPDWKCILANSGRFDVSICESPDGLSIATLSRFDLVVLAAGPPPGSTTEMAVAAFVAEGKGLVVTHEAFATAKASGNWPLTAEGDLRPAVRFLDVELTGSDHPIAQGMNVRFRTADSVPGGLVARAGAEVIATTDGGSGPVPVLAAASNGNGRIVALALGCDRSATHEPQFRALFARASEWAATAAVTLPAAPRPPGPSADAVKALLITGGHDHEAAFYSLFSRHSAIDWLPIDTAANAFKTDLRNQYDVIIMYDFTRDLDNAGKRNLRDFVESGKGIVVLHHALLNYQSWSWWSEDVVGGRYRLQREGESPASSVKNDQEIWARPVRSHPVLEGIHPFHITDEAYKNLYMAPRIKPLLTTDNPTSDTNLAWIGPCETSRVVAIQLGHGHSAFGHPSYQRLVLNAVLWAAGRSR